MSADDHLVTAAQLIARGEDYYHRAAASVVRAMELDPTLGYGRVAERVGKSRSWCQALVRWHTNGLDEAGPFSEAAGKPNRDESGMRKMLRERPEVIVDEVAKAPPDVQQRIRAALPEPDAPLAPAPRPILPNTIGEMEAEHGPMPAPPASRLAAILRIANDVDDLRQRVEQHGIETTDIALLTQAREACESITNNVLVINGAIADAQGVRA